ncbi:hypothetical protein, conserved [Leishmania tarentolae]|uniref:Vps72/YL1 N-terminal domain-containing protein n=1 Tax=Leishmania tarentolae TaxID=5689 RepID=A0A640KNE3_LEITA|nr:hypothetical protein, conserved [Leishmania tarentolae]
MEWADDVVHRPRRANAGNRLQELLANGLDEDEEKMLQALSDASSDSSFTLSTDEETVDEIESDFDAEEIGGTLEGEAVETEASVRRAEREERRQEQQKKLQRSQNFSKMAARDRAQRLHSTKTQVKRQRGTDDADRGPRQRQLRREGAVSEYDDEDGEDDDEDRSNDVIDLRQRVRHRPAPTITCSQRLAEAHARAAALRAAQAASETPGDGNAQGANSGGSAGVMHTHRGLHVLKARQRAERSKHYRVSTASHSAWERKVSFPTPVEHTVSEPIPMFVSPRIALYEGVQQRVAYSSGASVLQRFHVPTVVSFSVALPPVLQS